VPRIVLPAVIAPFLQAYPDIRVEVVVEDGARPAASWPVTTRRTDGDM
jgi:DNA-binding transcriptional LysR family regulator